ncbi:MAG: hypothetical protein BWY52_02134 [Chloroflexi bacterium ADurb.Bin325]|nr:MAG: hypothetical protein BWY52_02134 [Chloroflexi bacterium ADurb.Bin325]
MRLPPRCAPGARTRGDPRAGLYTNRAQRIRLPQLAEGELGQPLDLRDGCLVELEAPEDELDAGQHVALGDDVAGRGELAGPVVAERDHLPEAHRHQHPEVERVIVAEDRAGEHADAHVVLGRVFERILLEAEPDAGVERLELGRGVRSVEGVLVRLLCGRSPVGILATGHVAPAELPLRLPAIAFVEDLRLLRQPRVEPPGGARAAHLDEALAVDVHCRVEAEPALAVHHDREVRILGRVDQLAGHGVGELEHAIRLRARDRGQRHDKPRAQEFGVVARPIRQIVYAGLLLAGHLRLRRGRSRGQQIARQRRDRIRQGLVEQRARLDRIVGAAEVAEEVHPDDVPGVHVQHGRAGVAAQGRRIVRKGPGVAAHAHHTAGAEALDVVDRAEDRLGRLRGIEAVARVERGVADDGQRCAGLQGRVRHGDRRRQVAVRGQLEERDIGQRAIHVLQEDDLLHTDLERLAALVLLAEVDARGHVCPQEALQEAPARAGLAGKDLGDMPVGRNDALGDDPTRPAVAIARAVVHLDAADGRQPGLDDVAAGRQDVSPTA